MKDLKMTSEYTKGVREFLMKYYPLLAIAGPLVIKMENLQFKDNNVRRR